MVTFACETNYLLTRLLSQFLRATARSAKRVLAIVILSVRLSVCLSVTTRYQFKPRWDTDSGFLLWQRGVFSYLWANFVPLGEEIPLERGHQKGVPSKKSLFTTISSCSVRTVEDGHRLAVYHNTHCWRPFRGYQHRWPSTTLNPQNRGFYRIFRDFRLPHTFQEWTAPKLLETDQDNLHTKFSALKVDFNSVCFNPLGSRSPPYEGVKFGYPRQNARFLLLSTYLAWERLQIDLLLIIISNADDLSGGTSIDELTWHWNRKIGVFTIFWRF